MSNLLEVLLVLYAFHSVLGAYFSYTQHQYPLYKRVLLLFLWFPIMWVGVAKEAYDYYRNE